MEPHSLHLTDQQRRILVALLDGPMTTGECWKRLGITTLSQRCGSLERLGLVARGRKEVPTRTGKTAWVLLAQLTELGRKTAEGWRDRMVSSGRDRFDSGAASPMSHQTRDSACRVAAGRQPSQLPLFESEPLRPR